MASRWAGTAKGRNELRKFGAGAFEKLAIFTLGLGALRPIIDNSVDFDVAVFVGSLAYAIALFGVASYFLGRVEAE